MSQFTTLFERLAIDVMKAWDVTGAAGLLGLSWDEAWHLMDRAVERGQRRKPEREIEYLGVDEKAASKGHDYITLVTDLERGTVEHIADQRKQASLHGYWAGLTDVQRSAIKAVAMDMWEPCRSACWAHSSAVTLVGGLVRPFHLLNVTVGAARGRDAAVTIRPCSRLQPAPPWAGCRFRKVSPRRIDGRARPSQRVVRRRVPRRATAR